MFRLMFSLRYRAVIGGSFFALLSASVNALAGFPADVMSQPALRFFMDMTPGMGHQTHTATIMRRLREAGYAGRMEVVFYHDSVNEKLGILFPTYRPSKPDVQEDIANNLRFYHFEYSKVFEDPGDPTPSLLEPLKYAISGGNDRQMTRWQNFLAERLKVKYLITINPPGWANDSHIQFPDGGMVDMPEIRNSSTVESSWLWLPSERDATLVQRLESLKTSSVVVPAYPSSKKVNSMLPRIIDALSRAALGRTVVVPLVGDYGKGWPVEFMKVNAALQSVSVWTDLDTLVPGKVNLIMIPKLTPPTFSHVFSKMRFPMVVISGRNSINLAVRSGQPFLGSETPNAQSYPALDMKEEPHWNAFAKAHDSLLNHQGEENFFLENYFRRAIQEDAQLHGFHLKLAEATISKNPLDHVEEGLTRAVDVIRRVEAGSLCPMIAKGPDAPAWQ